MKYIYIVLCFICIPTLHATAQNLVPNPSFEEYDNCPVGTGRIIGPSDSDPVTLIDWYRPTLASSDYYHICPPATAANCIPNTITGYQMPRTGDAFVGVYGNYEYAPGIYYREYVEAKLNEPLIEGHEYYASYWLSFADWNGNFGITAIDQMGILFREDYIDEPFYTEEILETPQIVSPEGYIYANEGYWEQLSGTFTAAGDEEWIVIGNFTPGELLHIDTILNSSLLLNYYWIEDVCVIDLDGEPLSTSFERKTICYDDSVLVSGRPGCRYEWSDGSTIATKTLSDSSIYWVKSIDTAACSGVYIDSFQVVMERIRKEVFIGVDTVVCPGQLVMLDAEDEAFSEYSWSTGDTTAAITVNEAGEYYVAALSSCYFGADTIVLYPFRKKELQPLDDTIICTGTAARLFYNEPEFSFQWSTGDTECCINVADSGIYIVQATDRCGNNQYDTVQVTTTACSDCLLLPNAFTPNNDGLNDRFQPVNRCILSSYIMRVFNRWGQCVFSSFRPEDGWDGTFNGQPADAGVYFFDIKARPLLKILEEVRVTGDVTLLR